MENLNQMGNKEMFDANQYSFMIWKRIECNEQVLAISFFSTEQLFSKIRTN